MSKHIMIAAFDIAADARDALEDLRVAGLHDDNIGVLTPAAPGEHDAGITSLEDLEEHRTGEGAAVGLGVGATGGMFVALGAAIGIIPGLGPIFAAGTLAAFVASSAVGGAAGSVVGALVGRGIRDREAVFHAEELRQGRTVMVVEAPTDDLARSALDILHRHQARFWPRSRAAQELHPSP